MFKKIYYFSCFVFYILKYFFSNTQRYLNIVYLIFRNKPKSILEIGVYKGTRSLEMIKTSLIFNSKINYYGFDLFEKFYENKSILHDELSKQPYKKSTIKFKLKNLSKCKLYAGFTNKTLKEFVKTKKKIDFIFIDGGHSIRTIKNDWKYVQMLLHKKSIVLFDDFYVNNKKLSKKFGCNIIFQNKSYKKKFYMRLLPFTDCFISNKNKKCIKILKVIKK